MTSPFPEQNIVVIGGGPAGLMAAETLSAAGWPVSLFDAMPSVGRKFLLAGVGGMNITHSESRPTFDARYREAEAWVSGWLDTFGSDDLRNWVHDLGIDTFVGTSGRVFPSDMKAAPLLRAWLRRLRTQGVRIHTRSRWTGWNANGELLVDTPSGTLRLRPAATVLALGGGSWARLGSDGRWAETLADRVTLRALRPANCGFECRWSDFLKDRFAGHPLKQVIATVFDPSGVQISKRGECIVTRDGLEGSLIYAISAELRDQLETGGEAQLTLDLAPDRHAEQLAQLLDAPRKGMSLASLLRKRAGLDPLKIALLHECNPRESLADTAGLVRAIKHLEIRLSATRPLDEAISSAGGICQSSVDDRLMLKAMPGVFCAGEMLDWEAPTGGYLLTACLASGAAAGRGALKWLSRQA